MVHPSHHGRCTERARRSPPGLRSIPGTVSPGLPSARSTAPTAASRSREHAGCPFRAPPQGRQSPATGREIPAGGNQHLCPTDEFPWTAGAHQEQGLYPDPGSSRALPLYEEGGLRGSQGAGHPVPAQPIQSPRPVWRAGAEAMPPASEMADVRFRGHRSPSPNLGRTEHRRLIS